MTRRREAATSTLLLVGLAAAIVALLPGEGERSFAGADQPAASLCATSPDLEVEGTVVGRDVERSTLTVVCLGDGSTRTVRVHPVVVDITPDGDFLTVPKGYQP